jgi:hypothetical protein
VVTSVPQTVVPVSNVNDFVLGYNYATSGAYFNGRIDEVGVWGRALTQAEVMALYNSGAGIAYPFTGGTNTPPTASAGTSQSLPVNTTSTTLNGMGSSADGTITNYAWSQIAGPTAGVTINPMTSTTTGTTAVTGLTNGNTYIFQLTVTDSHSLTGTSTVNVTVASSNSPLLTGLLSYWPLDESSGLAIDYGGGGNNGTPTGVTQGVSGKINTAYGFNGTTSNVDMGNPANLSITAAGSLSCWVYASGNPSDGIVVSKGNFSSDTYGYGIDYLGSINQFDAELASGTKHQTLTFGSPVLNTWNHLVITWDGTTLKAYINDVVTTAAQTVVPVSNINEFVLGYNYATNGAYFNGRIDEVGVWGRALSAGEVAALYNAGAGVSYPFTGVIVPIVYAPSTPLVTNNIATTVTAYPNPYSSVVHFNLKTAAAGRGTLVIYDVLGRRVTTVFEGDLEAGDDRTVNYNFGIIPRQPLIYIFTIGDQVIHGKLMPGGY